MEALSKSDGLSFEAWMKKVARDEQAVIRRSAKEWFALYNADVPYKLA